MMRSRTKSTTLGGIKGGPPLAPIEEIPSNTNKVGKKFSTIEIGGGRPPPSSKLGEWEVRPGGMLVQKRDPDAEVSATPLPLPIRVRVKYGAVYHEIHISPQASFGELKKLLSPQIGLHPRDLKVMFNDKEKDSSAFLDISGVKDRSKLVVVEDPAGQAKRFLEMRKNAKLEKAAKSISQIVLEVDHLASQVSQLESIISKGKKVAEKDVLGLIEQLMNLLIKLDGIVADGDVKLQRGVQVRRVQKYIETLDVLKIKNSMPVDNNVQTSQKQQMEGNQQQKKFQQQKPLEQPKAVVGTKWETFDLLSSMPSTSSASYTTTTAASTTTTNSTAASAHIPRFDWELF